MPSKQVLEVLKKLEREEVVLARSGSGYGREQLARLALRLACQSILAGGPYPQVPQTVEDLTLAFLEWAEATLHHMPEVATDA